MERTHKNSKITSTENLRSNSHEDDVTTAAITKAYSMQKKYLADRRKTGCVDHPLPLWVVIQAYWIILNYINTLTTEGQTIGSRSVNSHSYPTISASFQSYMAQCYTELAVSSLAISFGCCLFNNAAN